MGEIIEFNKQIKKRSVFTEEELSIFTETEIREVEVENL